MELSPELLTWRPGFCATTAVGEGVHCRPSDVRGSWVETRAESCVARCRSCAQCKFVSFSAAANDCSWFAKCDMDRLVTEDNSYRPLHHFSFRVKHGRGHRRADSCTSEQFDRDGTWMPSTLENHFGSWRCPLWESAPKRFNCSRALPFRTFRSHKCGAPPSALRLLSDGQHRTIYFVGDSVSQQHQRAFACRLLHEAHRDALPVRLSSMRVPLWASALVPEHNLDDVCVPRCLEVTVANGHDGINGDDGRGGVGGGSLELCFVPAGMHLHTSSASCARSLADQAEALLTNHVASWGDLLLLNEGLHLEASLKEERLRQLRQMLSDNRTVLGGALHARRIGLAWRETSPQHFAGETTGAYEARHLTWYHQQESKCEPVQKPRRNKVQAELLHQLAAAGLPVVRVWDLSVSQWDTHLERRSLRTRMGGVDCTHFCEPSGVLEAWVDSTLVMLRSMSRRSDGDATPTERRARSR